MNTHNFNFKALSLVFILMVLFSCSTDDVAPALIEVSANETDLSEANGAITLTLTLNAPTTEQITIPLLISGTATLDADFSLSPNQIVINEGENSVDVIITAIQDDEVEGIETIEIGIGNLENVITLSTYEITISVLDDDSDTDGDGVLDAEDDCPEIAGDVENNGCPFLGFLINEVLYDPDSDAAGDANGDGTRDANDDEFIEFFNSGTALDISGYKIYDASALSDGVPRHVFPAGTIITANTAIVVFGGGTPTGSFGGALVQTASGGQININNAGDLITVTDVTGNVILTFDVEPLSDNPNESYTRNPDLTGDFVQHASVEEANGTLFSPGTKLDGSSF